jgi:hypothetical protein
MRLSQSRLLLQLVHRNLKPLAVVAIFGVIGVVAARLSHASTFAVATEAESGTRTGNQAAGDTVGASSSASVKFGTTTGTGGGSVTPISSIGCNYGDDTWSGDAANVGYTVSKLSATNGNPASFSVRLNANPGTTEVVGYPSDQCILYSAIPTNFASAFDTTPPANSSGLDYEYAYDIWLTTSANAKAFNWGTDLELMIWTYTMGQVPLGSVKATLADGSKAWVYGSNTTGTVSVVMPNTTKGIVDIAGIVSQLENLGYVSKSYDGILSAEYGIEAPYGGGQTFTVNSLSMGTKH